jgi:hypothetical protein
VPGIWAKPAPKLLQALVRRAGCDFATLEGCANFGFGSTNVCALTPELTATAGAIATTTRAQNTVQPITFMPRIFSMIFSNR